MSFTAIKLKSFFTIGGYISYIKSFFRGGYIIYGAGKSRKSKFSILFLLFFSLLTLFLT